MKKIGYIFVFFLLICCQSKEQEQSEKNLRFTDSITRDKLAREKVDSMIKAVRKSRYTDSTAAETPVKILSSKLVREKYSNYKNIQLRYKNISKKAISAIRFEWFIENAFGEPAQMSGINEGEGSGLSDSPLNINQTETSVWNIYSSDGKKIIAARAYEVAFSDGTVWKLRNE